MLDNFFPVDLALSASRAFPEVTGGLWDYQNDSDIEIKYRSTWQSEFDIPDDILPLVRVMNSSLILSAIGDRLGIPKLVPDPYFTGGSKRHCEIWSFRRACRWKLSRCERTQSEGKYNSLLNRVMAR